MPENNTYRKFYFYRETSFDQWSPQVQWGWVPGNIEDHGSGPEGIFSGFEEIFDFSGVHFTLPPIGQYMVIVQQIYDTHGNPPTTTWYFDVEKIPEKRNIRSLSTANMEFGYKGTQGHPALP